MAKRKKNKSAVRIDRCVSVRDECPSRCKVRFKIRSPSYLYTIFYTEWSLDSPNGCVSSIITATSSIAFYPREKNESRFFSAIPLMNIVRRRRFPKTRKRKTARFEFTAIRASSIGLGKIIYSAAFACVIAGGRNGSK